MAWSIDGRDPPKPGSVPGVGECHIWAVPIVDDDRWPGLLDADERARAEKYRPGPPRLTFVASRAVQRLVAARYLQRDPSMVTIRRGCEHCGDPDHGRPALADGGPLDYSVAHSGSWLVMAVVGSGRVGIDLEEMRDLAEVDDLAGMTLAAPEYARYRALAADDRSTVFYRTWTRKEAVAKLAGQGLCIEPNRIEVDEPVATVPHWWSADPIHVRDLPAPSGYAAALASTVEVAAVRLCRPHWT
ncbi:MAG TPA: 4'-phosphopantetheinyl transferase superfamily protein [Micromonosporaceae bacterium]